MFLLDIKVEEESLLVYILPALSANCSDLLRDLPLIYSQGLLCIVWKVYKTYLLLLLYAMFLQDMMVVEEYVPVYILPALSVNYSDLLRDLLLIYFQDLLHIVWKVYKMYLLLLSYAMFPPDMTVEEVQPPEYILPALSVNCSDL